MSIRKRRWTTRKGDVKEAWVVSYTDSNGTRRLQTFARKKAAEEYAARASIQVREGTHVADSVSVTVKKAGELWIAGADAAELEQTTIDQYTQPPKLPTEPILGPTLLSRLTAPVVRNFEDKLRAAGRSPAMVKRARGSLGALLA